MSTLKQEGNFIIQFAAGDSAGIDEVATINYYNEYFSCSDEYREPPEDFDPNLIDILVRVLSDPASKLRLRVSYIIAKLAECPKLAHAIADKGALTVLVDYVNDPDEKIRLNCLFGLFHVAMHCSVCNKATRDTKVMKVIETLMGSESIQPVNILKNATLCIYFVLDSKEGNALSMTGLILLILRAIQQYETDAALIENSMSALGAIVNCITDSNLRKTHIQAILNEQDLICCIFNAVKSGNPALSRNALYLVDSMLCGATNAQRKPLIMYPGFIKIIGECIDSSWSNVRFNAAWVLAHAADGPRHHIELILKEVEVIAQMMPLLHHSDKKIQEQMCWIFAGLFGSSADKPELTMEEFVENGVRTIVEFATKSGADTQIVNMIREVLPKQLLTHSDFARIAEMSSHGSRNAKFHLKKAKDCGEKKGFLSSLASIACFRAVTHSHAVHDSSGDATTSELPKETSG